MVVPIYFPHGFSQQPHRFIWGDISPPATSGCAELGGDSDLGGAVIDRHG